MNNTETNNPNEIEEALVHWYLEKKRLDITIGEAEAMARDLITQQATALLDKVELSVIGEDRQYEKYEPCPACMGRYQYACSCDTAEDKLRDEQRKSLAALKASLKEKI